MILAHNMHAQSKYNKSYFDGPYVFFEGDTTVVKWVHEGQLYDTSYIKDEVLPDLSFINGTNLPYEMLIERDIAPDHQTVYDDIDTLVAISDIHGQYDLMIKILMNNGVIDTKGNWNLGNGHLVVTGDIFDRGPKVLEIVWFMIHLERQAAAAGGKVHVMIGNHEWMVLSSDVRYVHKKYRYISALFRKQYHRLFDESSYLGRWLRSKPVYLRINGISFVHGGISETFFQYDVELDEINKYYQDSVLSVLNTPEGESGRFLVSDEGPLWYRGYAYKDEYDEKRTNKLLKKLKSSSIVVGHTSMPEIFSLHRNKIIFIDSSIKLGKGGELLIVENGKFYKGNEEGVKSKL